MRSLLIAVTTVAIAFVPTFPFADDNFDGDTDGNTVIGHAKINLIAGLRDRGIAASDVEEWGTVVRAFVYTDEGRLTMRFYDPDTLEEVLPPLASTINR